MVNPKFTVLLLLVLIWCATTEKFKPSKAKSKRENNPEIEPPWLDDEQGKDEAPEIEKKEPKANSKREDEAVIEPLKVAEDEKALTKEKEAGGSGGVVMNIYEGKRTHTHNEGL